MNYPVYSTQLSFCYVTHTRAHARTHKNTVMEVAHCSSVTVQYFCTVNAATIFPNSQFLFEFKLIKFEGDIAVSTSGRMGSIIQEC